MTVIFYILVLAGTFIAMEAVTWLTHRYVMHGYTQGDSKCTHSMSPT